MRASQILETDIKLLSDDDLATYEDDLYELESMIADRVYELQEELERREEDYAE